MQYEVTKVVSRLNSSRMCLLVNLPTSSGTRILRSFIWDFVRSGQVVVGYYIRLRWEPAE